MNLTVCDRSRSRRNSYYFLAGLSAAILLLASSAAQAVEPIDPVRVCRALDDKKMIKECMLAIDRVPVDPLAAGACLRLKTNGPVGICMRTIAGMQYTPQAIDDCDDLTNIWKTIQCFQKNGLRVAQQNFSGTYADQICPRLVTALQIEQCVAVFQVYYVQSSAALACDRINGAQATLDCIAAIAKQSYSEAEVAACDSLGTSDETIACFKREPPGEDPSTQMAPPPQYYNPPPQQYYNPPPPRPQPYYNSPPPRPQYNSPPPAAGGCNSYGCYGPGGGCNSYGCYKAGGDCTSYGCWGYGGGCNSYGCWRNFGGCNSYGCWHSRQGSCNSYGCTPAGECNSYGCPKLR